MANNKTKPKTIAIVGDQHATKCPITSWQKFGISGLPIWDKELPRMMEQADKCDRIIFSPGYPLMGLAKFREIKVLAGVPVEHRLLEFSQQERGFRERERHWQSLPNESYQRLLDLWLEGIWLQLERYPKIELFASTALYYSWELPFRPSAYHVLRERHGEKMINLSPLETITLEVFQGTFGELTPAAWSAIFPE